MKKLHTLWNNSQLLDVVKDEAMALILSRTIDFRILKKQLSTEVLINRKVNSIL